MKRLVRALLFVLFAVLAGYLVWDRVEAYRLRRTIDALAARGEPTDTAAFEEANAPRTPQEQEAARLYVEAVDRAADLLRQDGRLTGVDLDSVVGAHVTPEQIGETFRPDAPALQLIDRAATLPFAGFGDLAEQASINEWQLNVLSALPALRADLLSLRGDADAAAASLIVALRSLRTMRSPWYRSSSGARVFGSLRILLRHASPSDGALLKLQRAFEEMPDEDGLRDAMRENRARMIENFSDGSSHGLHPILAFALHPVLLRLSRQQIDQFEPVLTAAQQPWPAKATAFGALAAADPYFSGRGLRFSAGNILRYGLPNEALMRADYSAAGLNLVRRRVGVTVMAVERYRRAHAGAAPPSLDALVPAFLAAVPVDPFSGRALVYTPSAERYLLYSVGGNLKDDGGLFYGHGARAKAITGARPRADYGVEVPLGS